ncbi:MAG TPA: SWIM zinc finger family protein, partial [Myxococcaceae bacterium]|nr:SWIM zinc finger family protein [Myxococcaceae bacterium]
MLKPESDIQNLPQAARLIRSLRAVVPPTTFKKGREYAESDRVSQLTVDAGAIHATVAGGDGAEYSVEIRPAGDQLESRCECPAWDKYGPHCKHVVAAALVYLARLRASDEQGSFDVAAAESAPGPTLVKLESWLGMSALPDYEFLYRLMPTG